MATTTGTWSVTCSNSNLCGKVDIEQSTGKITFPANNTSSAITYTITYTDSQGYCGSKTMVQPSCGSSTCTGITLNPSTQTVDAGGGTATITIGSTPPTPARCEGITLTVDGSPVSADGGTATITRS